METDAERLQFVVQFAQMDLGALRAGDRRTVQAQFRAFFADPEGVPLVFRAPLGRCLTVIPEDSAEAQGFSNGQLQTLQQEAKRILNGYVDRVGGVSAVRAGKLAALEVLGETEKAQLAAEFAAFLGLNARRLTLTLTVFPPAAKQHPAPLLLIKGSWLDAFAATVMLLLYASSGVPILRCPECGIIFCRVRKQKYCSRPCTNRATVRRWRATPAGKEYEATRARKRHEKRFRNQTEGSATPRRRQGRGKASS
jgi:hypothetical protein